MSKPQCVFLLMENREAKAYRQLKGSSFARHEGCGSSVRATGHRTRLTSQDVDLANGKTVVWQIPRAFRQSRRVSFLLFNARVRRALQFPRWQLPGIQGLHFHECPVSGPLLLHCPEGGQASSEYAVARAEPVLGFCGALVLAVPPLCIQWRWVRPLLGGVAGFRRLRWGL